VRIDSGKSTPEAQLQSFYDRFDPAHQKFIRAVHAAVRGELVEPWTLATSALPGRAGPVTFANRGKGNEKRKLLCVL
jgi:hypothetical protein